jgi:hypothetical protein
MRSYFYDKTLQNKIIHISELFKCQMLKAAAVNQTLDQGTYTLYKVWVTNIPPAKHIVFAPMMSSLVSSKKWSLYDNEKEMLDRLNYYLSVYMIYLEWTHCSLSVRTDSTGVGHKFDWSAELLIVENSDSRNMS